MKDRLDPQIPVIPQGQDWIVERGRELFDIDSAGVCHGVSILAMIAMLLRQTPQLKDRLYHVNAIPKKELKNAVQIASNHMRHNKPTVKDSEALEINAFFQLVTLAHQPEQHLPFLLGKEDEKPRTQPLDPTQILPSILPQEMKTSPKNIAKCSGSYNQNDLKIYFNCIREKFMGCDYPFALILSSSAHTICVGFDRGQWTFFNINQISHFKEFNNDKKIAALTSSAFSIFIHNKNNPHILMTTQLLAEEQYSADASLRFQQVSLDPRWITIHSVTAEKLEQQDPSMRASRNWLWFAAAANDENVISDALKLYAGELNGERAALSVAILEHSDKATDLLIDSTTQTLESKEDSPLCSAIIAGDKARFDQLIEIKRKQIESIECGFKIGDETQMESERKSILKKGPIQGKYFFLQKNSRIEIYHLNPSSYTWEKLNISKDLPGLNALTKKKEEKEKKMTFDETPIELNVEFIEQHKNDIINLLKEHNMSLQISLYINQEYMTKASNRMPIVCLAAKFARHEFLKNLIKDFQIDHEHLDNLNGHSALTYAIYNADEKSVNFLLDLGMRPTSQDIIAIAECDNRKIIDAILTKSTVGYPGLDGGYASLLKASETGNLYAVRKLLERGSIGEIHLTKKEATPVFLASKNGYNEIIVVLLESKKFNINTCDHVGNTPLHMAATGDHVNTIKLLIENKANITLSNNQGDNALHSALLNNNREIALILIEEGQTLENTKSFLHAKNLLHETPLLLAAKMGHADIIKKLLFDTNQNDHQDVKHNTPLILAAQNGSRDAIKALLENKANISAINNDGDNALHVALREGHKEVIDLLLDAAVNNKLSDFLNQRNKAGLSPLDLAVKSSNIEAVKVLLIYHSKEEKIAGFPSTPLHYAADKKNTEILRILLENKFSVNARTIERNTPLIIAAQSGNIDNVRSLILNFADITQQNTNGETALSLALQAGHQTVTDEILKKADELYKVDSEEKRDFYRQKNKDNNSLFHIAAMIGNKNILERLIKEETVFDQKPEDDDTTLIERLNKPNKNNMNPLALAVAGSHTETVKLLLFHGAKDIQNKALNIAVEQNNSEMIAIILSASKPIVNNLKEAFYMTLLQGNVQGIKLFLEKCPKLIMTKDDDARTPLHIAAQLGNVEIAGLLLDRAKNLLEVTTPHGESALHMAVNNVNIDMVKFLLDNNASTLYPTTSASVDPDESDSDDEYEEDSKIAVVPEKENKSSPLLEAVIHNDIQAVRILLAAKATVEQKEDPLLTALNNRYNDIVITLLENGFRPSKNLIQQLSKVQDEALSERFMFYHQLYQFADAKISQNLLVDETKRNQIKTSAENLVKKTYSLSTIASLTAIMTRFNILDIAITKLLELCNAPEIKKHSEEYTNILNRIYDNPLDKNLCDRAAETLIQLAAQLIDTIELLPSLGRKGPGLFASPSTQLTVQKVNQILESANLGQAFHRHYPISHRIHLQ